MQAFNICFITGAWNSAEDSLHKPAYCIYIIFFVLYIKIFKEIFNSEQSVYNKFIFRYLFDLEIIFFFVDLITVIIAKDLTIFA